MTVRTADGEEVGNIEKVEGDVAHVKPNPALSESIRQRLGWSSESGDVYELRQSKVSEITDDGVHLKD